MGSSDKLNVKELVACLGGINNISSSENCVTRLRIEIKDSDNLPVSKKDVCANLLKVPSVISADFISDHGINVFAPTKVVVYNELLNEMLSEDQGD
jgi:phosphotransferase system IIB component